MKLKKTRGSDLVQGDVYTTRATDAALEVAAEHYRAMKAAQDEAVIKFNEAKRILIAIMQSMGETTYSDDKGRLVLIEANRTKTDWAAIAEELSEKEMEMVSVSTIDPKKFGAAVELGAIDSSVLLDHTTEQKSAPYIKETDTK